MAVPEAHGGAQRPAFARELAMKVTEPLWGVPLPAVTTAVKVSVCHWTSEAADTCKAIQVGTCATLTAPLVPVIVLVMVSVAVTVRLPGVSAWR